jgi:serine phosphatase RsbU (regulator of sigma subunit)
MEHPGQDDGDESDGQERYREDGGRLGASAQYCTRVRFLALLPSIVMPLDGVEHADAKDEQLEDNEAYGNPIDHFAYFQTMT